MKSARFSAPSPASFVSARGDAGERETEIDLLSVLRTLWRGKWLIALSAFVAVALATYYIWWQAVPLYTAKSVVALENRDEKVVDLQSVISGVGSDQASVNTEVEVLRSRGLIDKVVDQLNLESDPEFNVYIRPENPWSPGALLAMLPGARPTPTPSPRVIRDKTVNAVLAALSVSNVRQSYVFEIRVQTEDPEKSALIADKLADLYIQDQLEVKFEATEQATEWLTDRVRQLKTELDQAENAVQEFNSSIQLISPERLEAMNAQLKDFRDRYAGLAERQKALEQEVTDLEAAADSGDYARMAQAAKDVPGLAELQQQIAGGDKAAAQAFERRFEQALERARFNAQRSAAQLETMKKSIADLESQVATQSAQALQLEQLKREAEASRLIYEYFLGRLKETSVQQGIQQADSRVLSRAMLPVEPSWPRKGLLLTMALLGGTFVGAVLVILLETRNTAYRTAEEMQNETGTVVIGQVPRAPFSRRKRVLDYIISKPTSALVEAVRNVRTSILLSAIDRAPKIIMVSSSVPGEGKTMLSLALSQNLAGMGKKVLVIEGDMRRRTFQEIFEAKGHRGLLAAVTEEAPLEEIVFRNDMLGIDILLGERARINAADFFSSERFAAFLDRVREAYDFVVIDTPPVLVVPDARVIAQSADAVIYAVHWNSTPRRQVQQGLEAFASVNAPVTGLVLSQIDPRGMKRYGYSGAYGYGYGSYSKKYYES